MKKIIILSLIFVFSSSVALAVAEQNGGGSPTPSPSASPSPSLSPSPSPSVTPKVNGKATGEINKEAHRSVVSNFVQNLLNVADREGGIGEQVRVIAQEQNQSASTTIQAMEKIQIRSKVKTFFIGSDYKNLGELRSEMVQTENRLEQLNKLIETTQNAGDKTELQNQIKLLEQEQIKIESFINANESKFSLFGWLVKFFAK